MQLRQLICGLLALSTLTWSGYVQAQESSAQGSIVPPRIQDAVFSCGTRAFSAVRAVLVNRNDTPQTYTPVFRGELLDECINWIQPDCSRLPSDVLCIPTECSHYRPSELVKIELTPVTVPAHGEVSVQFTITNRDFLSAKVSVGKVQVPVVPMPSSCVF